MAGCAQPRRPLTSMQASTGKSRGVSLIIPCYNGAAFIGEAIDSALGQSIRPDEIIVVDDGSTDSTAEVIASFGSAVAYIYQDNQGEPAARNRGLAEAKAEYIAFLDADDVWPARSLEVRAKALAARPEIDFAFGVTEQFVSSESTRPAPGQPLLTAPVAGATLFRREVFDRVGLFDVQHRLGAMLDWFSRAVHAGVAGLPMAETVLRRRIHDSNSVHDTERLMADYLRLLRAAVRRNRTPAP